jgi:hypothetical protein
MCGKCREIDRKYKALWEQYGYLDENGGLPDFVTAGDREAYYRTVRRKGATPTDLDYDDDPISVDVTKLGEKKEVCACGKKYYTRYMLLEHKKNCTGIKQTAA